MTRSLGVAPGQATLYEIIKNRLPVASALVEAEGVRLIPASLELSGADTEFAALPGKERLVAGALKGVTGADALIWIAHPTWAFLR